MTSLTESIIQLRGSIGRGFNWQLFLQDNVTGSWWQMIWVAALTLYTAYYTVGQIQSLPITTILILVVWIVGIVLVAVGALRHQHTTVSRWLKNNLLSSVSNTLLTLLLSLVLVAAANGILQWAFISATFESPPPPPDLRPENGANWGVIWGARKLLLTGLLSPDESWRVWLSLGFIVVMWAVSFVSGRPNLKERLRIVRLVTNVLWLLSPIILYIFLAGVPDEAYSLSSAATGLAVLVAIYLLLWWQKVINFSPVTLGATALAWPILYTIWWGIGQSGVFSPINVDDWGGLLLTLIIASAVIVLSLPFGCAVGAWSA